MMKTRIYIILLVLAVLFLFLGIFLWFFIPFFVHKQILEMMPLKPGTLVYNQWKNTTLPVYMQFWFFNVVNKDEVVAGAKPVLQQQGPYTYREFRVKENITFNNNGTVSYLQRRFFHFDRSRSVGEENDTITTLNIPMIVIGNKIRWLNALEKKAISFALGFLENVDVFMEVSVKNITWGYIDPILELASKLPFDLGIDPHVGLFYGKNDTTDGIYTVVSGQTGVDDSYQSIERWNGTDRLSMWNTPYANLINGTDGSMFHPFLEPVGDKQHRLYIFQSDLCRSIYTEYGSQSSVQDIPSYNYVAPSSLFANHTLNPDNIGFCLGGKCLGSGVLNMSACIPLAPIVMSQPHLYQADPVYQDKVLGLTPGPDMATQLQLEPYTGLPLYLAKKLQINVAVEPVADFAHMDRLASMFLPVMWLNESAAIDDELASTIRSLLVEPLKVARYSAVAIMLLAALAILCLIGILLARRCHRARRGYSNIDRPINSEVSPAAPGDGVSNAGGTNDEGNDIHC